MGGVFVCDPFRVASLLWALGAGMEEEEQGEDREVRPAGWREGFGKEKEWFADLKKKEEREWFGDLRRRRRRRREILSEKLVCVDGNLAA